MKSFFPNAPRGTQKKLKGFSKLQDIRHFLVSSVLLLPSGRHIYSKRIHEIFERFNLSHSFPELKICIMHLHDTFMIFTPHIQGSTFRNCTSNYLSFMKHGAHQKCYFFWKKFLNYRVNADNCKSGRREEITKSRIF